MAMATGWDVGTPHSSLCSMLDRQQPGSPTCQLGDLITSLWGSATFKTLLWALFSSV